MFVCLPGTVVDLRQPELYQVPRYLGYDPLLERGYLHLKLDDLLPSMVRHSTGQEGVEPSG